jgi:hypothetical protein
LGANSGFDQPSMIALASSQILELGARLWKGCRPLARKMPGQNGAFPPWFFRISTFFAFLLLTEGSECMLYSVTECINPYEQTC